MNDADYLREELNRANNQLVASVQTIARLNNDNQILASENAAAEAYERIRSSLNTIVEADRGSITTLTLPEGITAVADYLFYRCDALDTLVIPEGVVDIGAYAFWLCRSLYNLTLPSTLRVIHENAFYNNSVSALSIPEGVTTIGANAFGNGSLRTLTLPSTLTSIGQRAFNNCRNLIELSGLSNTQVTEIAEETFNSCSSLSSIELPSTIRSIGRSAFGGCRNVTSLTLPASLTTIGQGAFYSANITTIKFPDGVTQATGFESCTALASITFGKNTTSIGTYAFYGCTALETLVIPTGVTKIASCAFDHCTNLETLTLPETLTTLESRALYNCPCVGNLTLPASLTTIGYNALGRDSHGGIFQVTFLGKTVEEVKAMRNYPFGLKDTTTIICSNGTIEIQ